MSGATIHFLSICLFVYLFILSKPRNCLKTLNFYDYVVVRFLSLPLDDDTIFIQVTISTGTLQYRVSTPHISHWNRGWHLTSSFLSPLVAAPSFIPHTHTHTSYSRVGIYGDLCSTLYINCKNGIEMHVRVG